jgi:hypothetical protein
MKIRIEQTDHDRHKVFLVLDSKQEIDISYIVTAYKIENSAYGRSKASLELVPSTVTVSITEELSDETLSELTKINKVIQEEVAKRL